MRTLTFEQITDSRFENKEECLPLLKSRIAVIKSYLNKMPYVSLVVDEPYKLEWPDGSIQWRANFRITKATKRFTWNDIYKTINAVKAVPYHFLGEGKP